MSTETLLIWLLIGAIAGWLASRLVRGGGLGLVGDIIVGIVGAFIGGWLLARLGIHIGTGFVRQIASATLGAIILLFVIRAIRRI